ncbi:MAG: hypothetical protein U1E73_05225 [Planctomycetota bacterium]
MSNKTWSFEFSRVSGRMPTRREQIRGVEYNVSISPFCVPMQMRVSLQQAKLVIEFDYPTDEDAKQAFQDAVTSILVGVASSRVQKIEVTTNDESGRALVDRVKVNLKRAADYFEAEAAKDHLVQDNYSVIAQSLRSEELLEPISLAS